MRKTYGNTWWGQQWLNALGNIDYSNRLPRGRTYANKGAARDIEISENYISAFVQGSRRTPYKVKFTIPAFTANEKAGIIEIITSNPLHLSKLLNRELPIELMDLCRHRGVFLFPNSWDDISGSCSCPDWAVPCKHMAAVLYLIANEIDKNPFLVFDLHDFDLFKGLEGIGYTASGQKDISIISVDQLREPYSFETQEYRWKKTAFNQLDFSKIPDCRENLLAILSDKPVFYPFGNFKQILKLGYSAVAKKISKPEKSIINEEDISTMDGVEELEIILDEEMDFLNCTFRDSHGKSIITFDTLEEWLSWMKLVPISELEHFSPALRGIYLVQQLARKLAQQSAYIPQLIQIGVRRYKIRWIPALLNAVVKDIVMNLNTLLPPHLLYYKHGKDVLQSTSADATSALLSLFLNHLVQNNHNLNIRFREHHIGHLFYNGSIEQFQTYETKGYPTAIQLWLNRFFMVEKNHVPVIQIDDNLAEEEDGFSLSIAVLDQSKSLEAPIPLAEILKKKKYNTVKLDILRDLAMLSDYFPQINRLVASKGIEVLHFSPTAFVDIMFKILPTIRLFGIKVLLPKALRKLLRPKVSMQLEATEETGIVAKSSLLNMDEMLNFQWQIAMGDQLVPFGDFLDMVKQFSGIVKLNDQYVFFDENEIQSILKKLENPPDLNAHQLLQIALTEDYDGAKVNLDKKARALIDRLLKGEGTEIPHGLKATLRPYQLSGYEWLYKNTRIGFGSLIADDMGLGKTLQVITTLLKLKEDGALATHKALVIVPTTLLTNWGKEIQKFAPSLKTHIYHGSNRQLAPLKEADVLITTYGIARSETSKLNKEKWLVVVIDEAQNIKNPTTAQTKAIKKIKAPVKIAMSGTPVENRLSEYWSIFDFANKGYLNTISKFKEEYARPIEVERNQEKLDHFLKVTQPFILRRLKSDKSIIKDLPDKIEKDQCCELTMEQSAIYQNVVDTTMDTIEKVDGIARKGLVLKLITALKQVCNHPKQFLKKGIADPQLSGKSTLLMSLMKQILANGEKTLIFTQYQEMGKMLVEMLDNAFHLKIPFLHGGVSRKQRDEMVDNFQNDRATRIMILSLKAGGTGLNLTAASNVIHYDLWWNPAVEAQATDRAYRIGQQNNVMVHRFITQGTFEEKINTLLQQKKELANLTVSTGEKWIGEFSNEELKELVNLD